MLEFQNSKRSSARSSVCDVSRRSFSFGESRRRAENEKLQLDT